MPKVKFVGPESDQDGTEVVEVDDVVIPKGETAEVTEGQLKRLKALPGLQFQVSGGKTKEE